MDLQYLKNVMKYVASMVLSIVIIAYIFYHITGGFQSGYETVAAVTASKEQILTTTGCIMREEQILYSPVQGDINYMVTDGTKVPAKSAVAEVFPSAGSEELRQEIIDYDRRIALLKKSNMTDAEKRTDTDSTDAAIWNQIFSMLNERDLCRMNEVSSLSENLLVQMNKRRIITRSVSNFDDRIKELEEKRTALSNRLTVAENTVSTGCSGYFYSNVDGYEEVFTVGNMSAITYDQYKLMQKKDPLDYASQSGRYAVGKLVTGFVWYVTTEVTSDQLHYFETDKSYDIKFPYNNGITINMDLYRIISKVDNDSAILVFSTQTVPADFNYLRYQTIQVVQVAYTGYSVPTAALRIVNDTLGVYVLRGSRVEFRKINPLIEYDGYCIASMEEGMDGKYKWLQKNEYILIKGKNLYDGKIID